VWVVTDPRRHTLDEIPSWLPEPYRRNPSRLVLPRLLRLSPVLGASVGASGPILQPQVVRESPETFPFFASRIRALNNAYVLPWAWIPRCTLKRCAVVPSKCARSFLIDATFFTVQAPSSSTMNAPRCSYNHILRAGPAGGTPGLADPASVRHPERSMRRRYCTDNSLPLAKPPPQGAAAVPPLRHLATPLPLLLPLYSVPAAEDLRAPHVHRDLHLLGELRYQACRNLPLG